MKRKHGFFIFCLAVILFSSLLLTGCVNDSNNKVEEDVVDENDAEVVEESEDEVVIGDFSNFSQDNQEIGRAWDETYNITFFSEKPMNGYHNFVFELEGAEILPNVSASYRSEIGAVRLTFDGIEENETGPGYQRAYNIENNGVVRIYHNISPEENEEVYDIGVSSPADFYLHYEEVEKGTWRISLDVRYPGEKSLDIDLGSDEFSDDEQEIYGATSSDGARVTHYSYTVEKNIFRFIWTVRGSEDKPIPSVRASYNEDEELVVVFPDLDSDTIGRDSGEMNLTGGLEKVVWSRVGEESTYRFLVGEKRGYRLASLLSPHQIILEIEL